MKYLFCNWKMYLDYDQSMALVDQVAKAGVPADKLQVGIFPNFVALHDVCETLKGSNILVGAQDVSEMSQGAYTGDTAATVVKSIGCRYALVGHSERRHVFGEKDVDIRKKMEACLSAGLVPILCVGETVEDKENDKRQYRLKKQLFSALEGLVLNGGSIIIAYEPVWAIGTHIPCDPAEADDVQGWIKQEVKQLLGKDIPVLYGGSVDAENVVSYVSRETVDGVLVGTASTNEKTLLPLIGAAARV